MRNHYPYQLSLFCFRNITHPRGRDTETDLPSVKTYADLAGNREKLRIKSRSGNKVVGHRWVKRLFIDKIYKQGSENPEENEDPADYTFIPATVEDNTHLLASPGGMNYKRMLANMPEDLRRAYRDGDWTAIGGNYFPEFSSAVHVRRPFKIPEHWPRYRSFDYGLDMFACYWWAVDEDGRSWCIREYTSKGLIVREAAEKIHENTLPAERIEVTYAPPDMWSRQKDTGKTMAEIYMTCGVPLAKCSNNRVQGHMMIKDMLSPMPLRDPFVRELLGGEDAPAKLPGLMFFDTCKGIIGDIQDIQSDEDNPNDCASDPHEITHTVDGVRHYCISRTLVADVSALQDAQDFDDEDEDAADYDDFMRGGAVTAAYITA